MFSPFEQFELNSLIPINIVLPWTKSNLLDTGVVNLSFTNSSFYAVMIVVVCFVLSYFVWNASTVIPKAWQSVLELIYSFVLGVVTENIGKTNLKYFPFLSTVFIFILMSNLFGMIPYCFTVTSHISITFALAFSICLSLLILGLTMHKNVFFKSFLPEGTPLALAPLLVVIELVSYSSHAISLSVRLFANILSGHALLKILAGFMWTLASLGGIFVIASFAPFMVVFALTGMEFGVAALQAYVFTVLTCIYLKDTLYLH